MLAACWLHPGCVLSASWFHLAVSGCTLAASSLHLAASWVHPGCILAASWLHPGCILAACWVHSGYILAASGCTLPGSWMHLGCIQGCALMYSCRPKSSSCRAKSDAKMHMLGLKSSKYESQSCPRSVLGGAQGPSWVQNCTKRLHDHQKLPIGINKS